MNLSERFLEYRLIFHLGNPSQDVVNSSQIQIQNHLNINWKIYSLLSSLPSRLGPAQHSLTSPSFCTGPASCWSPTEPPSPCPTGPSRTPQAQLASHAAHQCLGPALPQAPLANPRRGQLPAPPPLARCATRTPAPLTRASPAPLLDSRHVSLPRHGRRG